VQNLLAYWVGNLIVGVPYMLVPLMVLHLTPTFTSLSIAALMTVCSLTCLRQRAQLPTPGGNTSTLVLDSNAPTAISRLPGRAQDAPTEDRLRRARQRGHLFPLR
jgi:hypothetical protein